MRPISLNEVAVRSIAGEPFDFLLKEFLDEFYAYPSQEALSIEPPLLGGKLESGEIKDAYLAATAEFLACRYGFDTPAWSYTETRKLHHPWFALPMDSLRAVLLHESPAAFRSRNLFISENGLSRA